MTAINPVTDLTLDGDVAVITLNSPPVNALSANVRNGLFESFKAAIADPAAKSIVLICDGRTFIAGADITEFGGPGVQSASLFDVQSMMENSPKPVIAAIHGTALGGGLEVALCAHYRVAVPSARLGLPEVNLGLLPGAGGTQRLPRVAGVEKALEMMTTGRHAPAKEALEMGLVDDLAEEGKLKEAAVAFARNAVAQNKPLVKVRDNNSKVEAARGKPEIFDSPLSVKVSAPAFAAKLVASGVASIPSSLPCSIPKSRKTSSTIRARPNSSAMQFSSPRSRALTKDPVGLLGCTSTTARVRGVIAARSPATSICQPWS